MDEEQDPQQEQQEQQEQEQLAQQQAMQQQEAKKKADLRVLSNKLKKVEERVAVSQVPILTSDENKTVNQAKKEKSLMGRVLKVFKDIGIKIGQFFMKIITWVGSHIYPIMVVLLILLAVIGIVVFIGYTMPWLLELLGIELAPGEGGGGGTGSVNGVTGKDFYGVRMVYKDDEQASKQIIEEYVGLIEYGVNQVEAITSMQIEGETYEEISIHVNITLPEDYDYSSFNEATFATDYADVNELLLQMTEKAFLMDNAGAAVPTTILERTAALQYFGYTAELKADISKLISDYISNNYTFTCKAGDEGVVTSDQIKTKIETDLNTKLGTKIQAVRTEKLFIKDYIFTSDDDKMQNVAEKNYVSMIFMPKKNVNFESVELVISKADLNNFTIACDNNGSNVALKEEVFFENTKTGVKVNSYTATNVNAGIYENVDVSASGNMGEGKTLYDLYQSGYTSCLDTETEIKSYKKGGFEFSFNSQKSFICVELESKWTAA